ncbi:MAG: NTP transferase domain-containing protein [bacterium]
MGWIKGSMDSTSSEKLNAACLILAGGQGRRLSPDKPLLEIEGRPIIVRVVEVVSSIFEELLLVTNTPEKYRFLGLAQIGDERPGCGPLMGIYTGLKRIRHEVAFACAADMPFLRQEIIRAAFEELDDQDIVVPCPRGLPEYLHAYYRRSCLAAMRDHLDAGRFKIESLQERCRTRRLDREWFAARSLLGAAESAFVNINTVRDYGRWGPRKPAGRARARMSTGESERSVQRTAAESSGIDGSSESRDEGERAHRPGWRNEMGASADGLLASLPPFLVQEIRRLLVEHETAFQRRAVADAEWSSLWAHSVRVARIAHEVAEREGIDSGAALLAGLLHDAGKFVDGIYHKGGVAEEEIAAVAAGPLLAGTPYERYLSEIRQAILSLYREDIEANDLGRVVYDADRLDKMGYMGVAQFFAKNALRRHFLDGELLIRASIELTYAHHAPEGLKTAAGRKLARARSARTRRFYRGLLEEWEQFGLGKFSVREESIEGIDCVLVVSEACVCGGPVEVESDIRESVKCRSAVVRYRCRSCGEVGEFSFCLPNVKWLPPRCEKQH